MKIIDDYLSEDQFKQIQDMMMGNMFPWYYNDNMVNEYDGKYTFIHGFYDIDNGVNSGFFDVLYPLIDNLKLNKNNLKRIKANLNLKTSSNDKTGWHIDHCDSSTTSIFYLNSNNGWTQFKKGGKVENISNRMVIFDSELEHTGVTCTDENRRVMINFNYNIEDVTHI